MQCLHINIRRASFILLSFLINSINMVDNQMNLNNKELSKKNNTVINKEITEQSPLINDFILRCPSDIQCNQLPGSCIKCDLDENCIYGDKITTTCRPKPQVKCIGPREIKKKLICRYCYQTDHWEHKCELKANCDSAASPRETYVTNCTISEDIVCLGHRTFKKNVKCNWTGGYRWSTALALSVTLGGFGADRFYLGHWQEGIGKLFSFGGLGVWTLIDVILISLHYLGPADGSLYI